MKPKLSLSRTETI